MSFANELASLLPPDIPNRDTLIAKAAGHLDLIVEVNSRMNLTRVTDTREAVIKHVVDSVTPWHLFAEAKHVMDAGTGPGFPGLPLAVVLPDVRFTLCESTQKKARFVESAVDALDIPNVEVRSDRAEDLLRARRVDLITARALAPLDRALEFFGPALKKGTRALLYKGPDAESEIAAAVPEARKFGVEVRIVMRYDLPDALGSRVILQAGVLP